jgi:hypothetical protein
MPAKGKSRGWFENRYAGCTFVGSALHVVVLDLTAVGDAFPAGATDFLHILRVQTGSSVHPASCAMGTESTFREVKSAGLSS